MVIEIAKKLTKRYKKTLTYDKFAKQHYDVKCHKFNIRCETSIEPFTIQIARVI